MLLGWRYELTAHRIWPRNIDYYHHLIRQGMKVSSKYLLREKCNSPNLYFLVAENGEMCQYHYPKQIYKSKSWKCTSRT